MKLIGQRKRRFFVVVVVEHIKLIIGDLLSTNLANGIYDFYDTCLPAVTMNVWIVDGRFYVEIATIDEFYDDQDLWTLNSIIAFAIDVSFLTMRTFHNRR